MTSTGGPAGPGAAKGTSGTARGGSAPRAGGGGARSRGRLFRGLALVLAASVPAGCATYTAARPASVQPGQEVRITLDPGAPAELTEFVSGARGSVLVGTVTDRDAEGLMVAVPSAVREQGLRNEVFRQRVRIPESEIVGLEIREIDRTRTGLVVALGLAAVVTAVVLILSGSAGGAVEGSPQPPPQMNPSR